ncbi:30S ribosomal protein S2 [Candidatus Parcubacteria bacterium]|nr:30S ribosomal protein S2 [Candidatus Parcubacteria bacterium]
MITIKETKEKELAKKSSSITCDFGIDLDEMLKAGVHFGHRASQIHPKMKPYIYGTRSAVHIISLEATAEKFEEALRFIEKLIADEKNLILVGTKIQIKNLAKGFAEECGFSYVTERWIGGTFTNFETIKKRVEYFKDLEKKKAEGGLEKYKKKEKIKIDKELQKLKTKFGGIKDLEKLPNAIFVLDVKKDILAVKEAKIKGVKVIGIIDTNVDPGLVDYPIPANDDALSSIKYILEKAKEIVLKAKQGVKKPAEDNKKEKQAVSEKNDSGTEQEILKEK